LWQTSLATLGASSCSLNWLVAKAPRVVAAMAPTFIARSEVSPEVIEKAKEVFSGEVADKPADMQEKIMEGKLSSYFKDQRN
jgi:translation elongation factor EF-Ts